MLIYFFIQSFINLLIIFQGSLCCLRKPDDNEPLKNLLNEWLKPEELILVSQNFISRHFDKIYSTFALFIDQNLGFVKRKLDKVRDKVYFDFVENESCRYQHLSISRWRKICQHLQEGKFGSPPLQIVPCLFAFSIKWR